MATKSSPSPTRTTAASEAIIVLSSEVSSTTAPPAASATTSATEASIETKLALWLWLTGESSAMSSAKSGRAESLRLLAKVIETWGKGSKLTQRVTLGLTLVLLET